MAAGTSALIGGGAGLLMGGYQAISGNNTRKKAQRELNNYTRQTLDNAFENVSISTLGSDLVKEESQRRGAGMVDALQGGGIRGVVGGIPKVVATMNEADMRAAKMLDDQYINREYAIAGDNARIEGIIENRDNMNIAALSSQVNAGRQDFMNGLMGMASGVGYIGRNLESEKKNNQDPQSPLNIQPMGPTVNTSPYAMPIYNQPYMF